MVRAVLRASAIYVAAYAWCRAGEALEVVVPEVRFHVSEAHNFRTEMALRSPSTIGKLMRRQARKQQLWVRRLGGIAFLRDLQVTEAAEDEFAGAGCGFVVGESRERGKVETARGTSLRGVVDGVVLLEAEGCVTGKGIVWTMPVVLECWGTLLEDLPAPLRAENVVSETEVLVKEK